MTSAEYEKEFIKGFQSLCRVRSSWEVWQCLISTWACAISNAFDKSENHYQAREEEYAMSIRKLGDSNEVPAQLLAIVTHALELNPDQDFLGKLYMNLELGSHWKGQFFTPYNICRMMAGMQIGEKAVQEVDDKGWISICDPACGAGATLVAAANELRAKGINYQTRCCFIGQDVDRVVAQMCYIQLSLLGCPGYVMVANTLSDPLTGPVLWPEEKRGRRNEPDQELWFTPMWASEAWTFRRKCFLMDHVLKRMTRQENQPLQFVFRFDGKEPKVEVVRAG